MSAATTIRDRLRDQPLPGEAEATARSWPVVEAALADRSPAVRRRRTSVRVALVLALLCAALVTALSPAGAWIGDRFHESSPSAKPAFADLPRGGSVLAISKTGAYAVRSDGSTRRLGAFSEAGWSPHGLHVAGVEGRRLVAVDAAGTVKWMLTARGHVSHPAWSTDLGYAVAYLEGRTLKVVAGNGDPATNRVLRPDAAPVTPAWRPHSDRVLTYAATDGALATLDVDSGRILWIASPALGASEPVRSIAWSAGGRRLVALRSRSVTVLDRSGRTLRRIPLPGVARAMAVHAAGTQVAVVVGRRVLEANPASGAMRQRFQGDVDGIAWSQDGRRLLLGWRDADQWLLLGPGGRIRALHGVSGELGAAGGFPRVAAWCCPR